MMSCMSKLQIEMIDFSQFIENVRFINKNTKSIEYQKSKKVNLIG